MQSSIVDNLQEPLERYLNQAGIYYRMFGRVKSPASIEKKMAVKKAGYEKNGKKMQDFVGIRIIFYFQEDVEIFHEKLKTFQGYDPANESSTTEDIKKLSLLKDEIENNSNLQSLASMMPLHDKVFMPQRLNLVMKMPNYLAGVMFNEIPHETIEAYGHLIDDTYEIQLRTVLSEGWHEVEHDLRYKTIGENWWKECQSESRQLNGIYASLEANEHALFNMISNIAYKNYKSGAWDAMIRNHFCLRFKENKLSDSLKKVLDQTPHLAKLLFQTERSALIKWLWQIPSKFSLTTDLVLCLANRRKIHSPEIEANEPAAIKMILDME